ncbi:hypothetical protein [Mycoplasma mycoides]|uniref:hypothetical protein n=1 Tax=Mycoplasma mycoides TaxID=2102 RepID=UPI0002E0EF15|nr:hypothetical protein [Mycoplasma mycoides]
MIEYLLWLKITRELSKLLDGDDDNDDCTNRNHKHQYLDSDEELTIDDEMSLTTTDDTEEVKEISGGKKRFIID